MLRGIIRVWVTRLLSPAVKLGKALGRSSVANGWVECCDITIAGLLESADDHIDPLD